MTILLTALLSLLRSAQDRPRGHDGPRIGATRLVRDERPAHARCRRGRRTARRRRPARRAMPRARHGRSAAPPRARRTGRRRRRPRTRTGRAPATAPRLQRSPHTSQVGPAGNVERHPDGSAVTWFATTRASTPSRRRIGSIVSWNPAETISGSCSSTSSRNPGRTRTSASIHSTTSSSGAVIVAISRPITSSSVMRPPTSSSRASNTARSPNRSITMCSVSRSVTVPSQSRTSGSRL